MLTTYPLTNKYGKKYQKRNKQKVRWRAVEMEEKRAVLEGVRSRAGNMKSVFSMFCDLPPRVTTVMGEARLVG